MNLDTLTILPPWEWPEDAGADILAVLRNPDASEMDRLLAAELAGEFVVAGDDLALALLNVVGDDSQPQAVRARSAISLGPVLEYASDEYGLDLGEDDIFAGLDDVPITEETFDRIGETLQQLYTGGELPKDVQRSVLEASVRAPQDWHADAVRAAFHSDDEMWRLTAVFCMRFVEGFDREIAEALESTHADTYYQAICAAGARGVDEAWTHVTGILEPPSEDKPLLLAAIEAAPGIRPSDVSPYFVDLMDHDDEDIVEAVHEALVLAEAEMGLLGDEDEDEDGDLAG